MSLTDPSPSERLDAASWGTDLVVAAGLFLMVFGSGLIHIESFPPLFFDEGWTVCVARTWVETGHHGCLLLGAPAPPSLSAHFPVVASVAASFALLGVGVWQTRVVGLLYTFGALLLLYAVTQQTAAELVMARADPSAPNMALTSWEGSRVRKADVIVAKNYLSADEVDTLNRLVVIFLEQAELRTKQREALTLDFWRSNVDRLLAFSERPVLKGAGSVSSEDMKQAAWARFERFDAQRRTAEALAADAEDLRLLEALERRAKDGKQ